jgi:hypothetical protein
VRNQEDRDRYRSGLHLRQPGTTAPSTSVTASSSPPSLAFTKGRRALRDEARDRQGPAKRSTPRFGRESHPCSTSEEAPHPPTMAYTHLATNEREPRNAPAGGDASNGVASVTAAGSLPEPYASTRAHPVGVDRSSARDRGRPCDRVCSDRPTREAAIVGRTLPRGASATLGRRPRRRLGAPSRDVQRAGHDATDHVGTSGASGRRDAGPCRSRSCARTVSSPQREMTRKCGLGPVATVANPRWKPQRADLTRGEARALLSHATARTRQAATAFKANLNG